MADPTTELINTIMNGKTAGIPNIFLILLIGLFFFFIYMTLTKNPRAKDFKPLDMKKETKRRFKRLYKYFGKGLQRNIYTVTDPDKPVAFAIGYMKVVEMEQMKRLEPIHTKFKKKDLDEKHDKCAMEVYNISYSELNDVQKKNIDEVAKEELRNEETRVTTKGKKTAMKRGKLEVEFSVPVPMFAFKVCRPKALSKLMARFLNRGIDWMLFSKEQITFETDRVTLTADFQQRTPFDVFVFSKSGKNLVEDISYAQERENIWQETANQIPRAVHFDTEASKSLLYRREDAKLEREKRRSQTESRERM